ncbi:cysteine proteinase [Panus rudis PR-1116 ss-1]|nr:cysteine proteinase [Panus rudis PR-1116 ss-1]
MPPKRTRRVSPSANGAVAGERLKRARLAGHDYSTWGWVGTDVTDASQITLEHRLATCGLSRESTFPFCANRFSGKVDREDKPDVPTQSTATAGELEDDVIVVSDDDEFAHCDPKNCRNNPNCLNYLGQEKWEDEDKALASFMRLANLGENPLHETRVPGVPVGLKNLGATCYANAFLQVWFQDLRFRSGVYRCQPAQDNDEKFQESPIFQLQVTFAAMQEGIQSAFNPVNLVESLKLRTTEQQDAQEFSKLFMAHLETEFQKQTIPGLKSLMADQFQGKQVYGTLCSRCQTRSERESDFLEIEVNLLNNSKLEDRLEALLEPEELSGDNKYHCSVCDSLQDAQRYTEFRTLPPVLHVSLLRFVFDLSTMERKKSKHSVTFPLMLDMDQFLGSAEQRKQKAGNGPTSNLYQLRGVLLHKGPSAYHGHYEAQVFDVSNNAWYQFNDESVTKIPSPGTKSKSSASSEKTNGSKAKKSVVKERGKPPRKKLKVDDSEIQVIDGPASSSQPHDPPADATDEGTVTSKDAYMLVYARVPHMKDVPSDSVASTETVDLKPPPRALDVVNTLNTELDKACKEYATKEKALEQHFQRKRRMVMDIYRSWCLSSHDEKSAVISRQALELWLSYRVSKPPNGKSKEEDAIDEATADPTEERHRIFSNADIQCDHGKLDPDKAGNMKRIRLDALQRIAEEDDAEFIPQFEPEDVCDKCTTDIFNERLYQIQHPKQVARFDELDYLEGEGRGYWISKAWLKDWKLTKPKMHIPSQPDPPPDDVEFVGHVRCEHGSLSTNTTSRRRISEEAYSFLGSIFPNMDLPHATSEICSVCEALMHISKEDKREIRKQAEDEKAKLKYVFEYGTATSSNLLPGSYAVVPDLFIRAWKQWLFRPTEMARPDGVNNATFLCEHSLLCFDPNVEGDVDGVAYIRRGDWDILQDLYQCDHLIAVENTGTELVPELPVCEECRRNRRSCYDTTNITIRILKPEDPIPTTHTPSPAFEEPPPGPGQLKTYGSRKLGSTRQSKRIRQVKDKNRIRKVTITRSMLVKDLKVKVQEEVDIPTIYQRLFYNGQEIEDNSVSLASLGVMANDTLYLREESEDVDLLDDDGNNVATNDGDEGRGFGGTLLGGAIGGAPENVGEGLTPGHISCPACTYSNPSEVASCEMCETPLKERQ